MIPDKVACCWLMCYVLCYGMVQENGRTSAISIEIMGYAANGDQVHTNSAFQMPPELMHDVLLVGCNSTRLHSALCNVLSTLQTAMHPVFLQVLPTAKKNPVARWMEVVSNSDRNVTLIDLCGHERYLKTTVSGLTGLSPDLCLLVVGANMGVQLMTREHISVACALQIPLVVVVSKVRHSIQLVFIKYSLHLCCV
jgi:Elongation factor Tu GTP binding domain